MPEFCKKSLICCIFRQIGFVFSVIVRFRVPVARWAGGGGDVWFPAGAFAGLGDVPLEGTEVCFRTFLPVHLALLSGMGSGTRKLKGKW